MIRRVPLALQSEAHECGLACLAMVVGTYERAIDLPALRAHVTDTQFRVSRALSMQQLAQLGISLGFNCRGVRAEPGQLQQLRTPAILHWRMNHFVVLISVRKRYVIVHDPACGRRRCSWQELDGAFTGVALELWPGQMQQTRAALTSQLVQRPQLTLLGLVKELRFSGWSIAWLGALTLLLQLLVLAGPWHVQWTVDEAIVAGDTHLLGVLAIGFGLLHVPRSS